MSAATQDIEHPTRTRRSQHRYLFTSKHHGGDKNAARWLPEISRNTEFSIFDDADLRQIADRRGWLYGVLADENGKSADHRGLGRAGGRVSAGLFPGGSMARIPAVGS